MDLIFIHIFDWKLYQIFYLIIIHLRKLDVKKKYIIKAYLYLFFL